MNVGTNYDEVDVMALAGTNPIVSISFRKANLGDGMQDLDFDLSESQIKWLIKALKQARELAFR